MNKTTINIAVSFGSDLDLVTIKRSDRSSPIVAGLLGVDKDEKGEIITIYLRSKIHSNTDDVDFKGWSPSGAITTILNRCGD